MNEVDEGTYSLNAVIDCQGCQAKSESCGYKPDIDEVKINPC